MFGHLARPETGDQRQAPGLVLGVELLHQNLEVLFGRGGAAFQPDRVDDPPREFDMRAVRLPRAVTDPDHVARPGDDIAGGRIDPRQRLFVFE